MRNTILTQEVGTWVMWCTQVARWIKREARDGQEAMQAERETEGGVERATANALPEQITFV